MSKLADMGPIQTDIVSERALPSRRLLVAAVKGGVGKTTLSVNLAAYALSKQWRAVLVDCDVQRSASDWATLNSQACYSNLQVVAAEDPLQGSFSGWSAKISPTADCVILDMPAGLRAHHLTAYARRSDTVLIPLQPSVIDLKSTRLFLAELRKMREITERQVKIGLVINRAKPRTLAMRELEAALHDLDVPIVARIRDSQAYVQIASLGRSLFDIANPRLEELRKDWHPLLEWLDWKERPVYLDAKNAVVPLPVSPDPYTTVAPLPLAADPFNIEVTESVAIAS